MKDRFYKIVKLDPSISTENLGDYIISQRCSDILSCIFEKSQIIELPIRDKLMDYSLQQIHEADYSFLCGTNLLAANMNKIKQWNVGYSDIRRILLYGLSRRNYLNPKLIKKTCQENQIIMLGTGWWQYQEEKANLYTKNLLRNVLSNKYIHSVRDSYTVKKLQEIGINNVVNTSCPTMWNLNTEFCDKIPKKKATQVITTLTNYYMNKNADEQLLDILIQNYKIVYVWLQTAEDYVYLQTLKNSKDVKVIYPKLSEYVRVLQDSSKDIDYVGTRLHGGIQALNCGRRSIIVAVDNRAREISKDTGLPVVFREDVSVQLDMKINKMTDIIINLPYDNIQMWKEQFK